MFETLKSYAAGKTGKLSALLLAATLSAYTTVELYSVPPVTTHAGVTIKIHDPSLQWSANLWRAEIARRFPNAVGVLAHGGEVIEGEWFVKPEGSYLKRAADVVRDAQRLYPGKQIVLLACNPGHLQLGVPGVYYARDSVWCVPDRESQNPEFMGRDRMTLDMAYAPWDGLFPSAADPIVVFKAPPPTRWQTDPTVAGSIFEFVQDGE